MTYDSLKYSLTALACTVAELVADKTAKSERMQFLVFGQADHGLVAALHGRSWRGVKVQNASIPESTYSGVKEVYAHVGPDERIVQTLDGHWVNALTVEQIYRQFPGPYDVIAAIGTGKDRMIWWTPEIQATLPKVYVILEDTHNEDLINCAGDRGYESFLVEDCLVMVHE